MESFLEQEATEAAIREATQDSLTSAAAAAVPTGTSSPTPASPSNTLSVSIDLKRKTVTGPTVLGPNMINTEAATPDGPATRVPAPKKLRKESGGQVRKKPRTLLHL